MLKELYEQGYGFEKFMNADGGEHVDKVMNFLQLSEDAITESVREKLMAIDSAHVVVFGEVWCPDCMINVAVLEVMHNLNNNIKYSVVPRTGFEEQLKSLTPDHSVKIPTFVSVDANWEVKGVFLEKPQVVKDVEASDDQVKRIVIKRDYRNGKYVLDTMEEIIGLL